MAGYRKPYTVEEEKQILQYIIQENGYHLLRGYNFWKQFVKDEKLERSYQSLHERFRKHIINNLHHPAYCLSREEQKKIRTIYEETAQKSRKKKKKTDESPNNTMSLLESNSDDSDETNDIQIRRKVVPKDEDTRLAPNFFELSDFASSDESIVYL